MNEAQQSWVKVDILLDQETRLMNIDKTLKHFLEEKKTANHDDQKLLAFTVSSSDFWNKVFNILVPNLLTLHMPTIKFWKLILRIGISGSKDSKSR